MRAQTFVIVFTLTSSKNVIGLRLGQEKPDHDHGKKHSTEKKHGDHSDSKEHTGFSFSHLSDLENRCVRATPRKGTMKQVSKYLTLLNLTIAASHHPGDIMMAGIAQGGDAWGVLFVLACTGRLEDRKVYLFDTWEGLPSPTAVEDRGFKEGDYHVTFESFEENGRAYGRTYDALLNDLPVNRVSWADAQKHVETVKGLFGDTMPGTAEGKSLAFLSCDGDMYISTMDCLNAAAEKVVSGGPIYQDDYYVFTGNYKAVNEYRQKHNITSDAAPMYIVEWSAQPVARALNEDFHKAAGNCKPPSSNQENRDLQGHCWGKRYESGYWIQP